MLNAGAAIYVSGVTKTYKAGIERAMHAIESGDARRKLDEYVSFTQRMNST